jgi:hypothetical protein
MICTELKECMEKTQHVFPKEKKTGKKGKRAAGVKKKEADLYQQPLCQPPCKSSERQKGCIEFLDCRPKVTCQEKGKSYTLDQGQENPRHEVMLLHIDGGVITNPEASTMNKCDYAILVREGASQTDKKMTAFLIELKGKQVDHALKQLKATLYQAELAPLWESSARVFGRIVCKASVPRIQRTDAYLAMDEEFRKRGGNLKMQEVVFEEEYRNV